MLSLEAEDMLIDLHEIQRRTFLDQQQPRRT
jgi:hypothetical protein